MNSSITNNVLWKFAERISAQLVSFIVSLVLARLLTPDDYGAVAMVLVFITVANIFVSDGLGSALIQKKDADQLDFCSVLYANIAISIILYIILFILAPFISDYYNNRLLTPVFRVIGIRLIFAAINSVQQAYVSKQMQFRKFFFATLAGTVTSCIVGLVIAYSGGGVWALVYQYLTNVVIDTIILGLTIKWRPSLIFSFQRILKLFSFGWKILVEGVSNTVAGQLRNLIIGKVYTSADLGYYTKAQQFPQLVINNISASIGAVMFPAMASVQNKPDQVLQMLRKSVRVCSYILFPCFFGMAAVSDNLIIVLLGEKWAETSVYLIILCFTTLLTVGMYPRHQALKATGRSDIFMYEHMISRIIGLILLFLVYKISVLAIALTGIGSAIILTFTVMFTSYKFNSYKYKDQIEDILLITVMCVVMFIPTYLIGKTEMNKVIELLLQIVCGAWIYFGLSLVFKPEGFIFIRDYLLNITKRFGRNKI